MSNRAITYYPNYLYYDSGDLESNTNMDVENEPTITGESWTASGGEDDDGTEGNAAYDLVDNKRGSVVTIDSDSQGTTILIDFDLSSNITIDTVLIDECLFELISLLSFYF